MENENKQTQTEPTTVEPGRLGGSNKVEVSKEGLDKLLNTVKEQDDKIKMLLEIADKGRLAHWQSTHKSGAPKTYYLTTYTDKEGNAQIITSWRMLSNNVWKDAEGVWREKQEIEVEYENGKKDTLAYVEFGTKTSKVPAKLLSTTQKGGKTIFEVETEDKKKLTVDSTFVN